MTTFGFTAPINAVVIGASGGIGKAMVDALLASNDVRRIWVTARTWSQTEEPWSDQRVHPLTLDVVDEESVARLADAVSRDAELHFVVNCSGRLHTPEYGPERALRHLDLDTMRSVFDVNTFGVALLLKHLIPQMCRRQRSVFSSLSARVSSIADNRIGGWYSYRASKTAQNMFLKTAALEVKRGYAQLIIVGLHPGTVDTSLSAPFTKRLAKTHHVFAPSESVAHLQSVIERLSLEDSGQLFAWDGQQIPW